MAKLTVGFDDQIFLAQQRGGISKYFVELVQRLPEQGIDPVILSTSTRNIHLAESGLVPEAPPQNPVLAKLTWATWRIAGRPRTTPRPLPRLDVLHHTFTHPSYLGMWRGPRVVTVFDMTPELFPEYFKLGNPHFAKRTFCERSDAVISISENTAQDMARLYSPAILEKTHTIPFGVGEQFFGPYTNELPVPERYLLFVGVRSGYKDFPAALEAWRRVAATDDGLDLVVAGGGAFTPDEERALAATGMRSRIHRVAPSDATMPELYRRAEVFLFPSRYEGFGLPTLEALAAGVPVVLADASCSREVGGDAALYFAPGDVDALVAQIRRAQEREYAQTARTTGPAHARLFSWDRLAATTAELYRTTAQKKLT